jgi:ABC-2 type transport system permease protein
MRRAGLIAGAELRLVARSRLGLIGLLTLVLLSTIAAISAVFHMRSEQAHREVLQSDTDQLFEDQPDRHPHRMVHYGTYVYRPLSALAAFDPGVDPFAGTTLYLEGHRQNSATFGAVRENSSLMRFGQLTPAFVLQILAPLLLIFLGFSLVAREHESGSLRQLRAHGARGYEIILGKGLALTLIAGAALTPALIALAWIVMTSATPSKTALALSAGLIGAGVALYLLVWVALILAVSALTQTSRSSLAVLVAIWAFFAVIVPRGAAELAHSAAPLPTRAETDVRLAAEVRQLGDSHNPNDPFFSAFRARLLAEHGVSRVEDLPFNYRGALSSEGEALTAQVFDRSFAELATVQRTQAEMLTFSALVSPTQGLRRMSLAGAGTDLETHLRFLQQAEAYRFDLIQRLNAMHRDLLSFADDNARNKDPAAERRTRVAAGNWAAVPDFGFVPTPMSERLAAMAIAGLALLAWLAAGAGLCALGAQRLERGA